MAELADVQDLGSCVARRVGSNPTTRTMKKHAKACFFNEIRLRRVKYGFAM